MIIPREREFSPWLVAAILGIAALIFGTGVTLGIVAGRGSATTTADAWKQAPVVVEHDASVDEPVAKPPAYSSTIPAAAFSQALAVKPPRPPDEQRSFKAIPPPSPFLSLVPDISTLGSRIPPTAAKFNNTPVGRDTGAATGNGELSKTTGQPRSQLVSGYYRADGTYVAPYYRSVTSGAGASTEPVVGHTATGLALHEGPRGGIYHYSASGNKVYEKKK